MYEVHVPEAVVMSLTADPHSAALAALPMRRKKWGRGNTWIIETRRKTDIQKLLNTLRQHEPENPVLRPVVDRAIERCHDALR